MKYNDGGKKDPVNIKDKASAIKEFAEGNKALEALLKYCFDNGILTEACCKGHDDNLNPYISFYVCKENEIYIKNIIDKLLEKGYHFLYKSNRLMLPSLTIRTTTDDASNLFNTLLNIFENAKNIELDGLKKKIYRIYANTSNNDTTLDIKKVDDKYDANIYFDFGFENVLLDENELMNTLDKKLRLSRIDINNDIGFKEYNPNLIQERMWLETKLFLEENNIRFKDDKRPDFINVTGAYGKNTNPDLELVVEKDDDISIVATKLELLKKKFIDAKAVLNGIELTNVVIEEKIDKRNKTRYINVFNKENCIEYYNREILRFVDKYLFNEELIILEDNPLCISFRTNTLTDDEIANRLLELKEDDSEIINKYFDLSTKNNNASYKLWHNYAMFNYKYYNFIHPFTKNDKFETRKKLIHDIEISFAINAVNGFKNSLLIGGKNKNKTFQDLLRLIDIFFTIGDKSVNLLNLISESFDNIDIDAFLNVLPQLLCRFDLNNIKILEVLFHILIKIGLV